MEKNEHAAGYKAPRPEKETGKKDELKDHYVDDRAAQPEYVGRDPEYFNDPMVITEDDPLRANDVEDLRKEVTD